MRLAQRIEVHRIHDLSVSRKGRKMREEMEGGKEGRVMGVVLVLIVVVEEKEKEKEKEKEEEKGAGRASSVCQRSRHMAPPSARPAHSGVMARSRPRTTSCSLYLPRGANRQE